MIAKRSKIIWPVSSFVCGLIIGFVLASVFRTEPNSSISDSSIVAAAKRPPAKKENYQTDLDRLTGKWISIAPSEGISVEIDYRILTFSSSGKWDDLDGSVQLLGGAMDFIFNGDLFELYYVNESLKRNRDSSISIIRTHPWDGDEVSEIDLVPDISLLDKRRTRSGLE